MTNRPLAFLVLIVLITSLCLGPAATSGAAAGAGPSSTPSDDPVGVIRGAARTEGGVAVQNARIVAQKVGASDQVSTLTAPDGAYTLSVTRGSWRVRAETTANTIPTNAIAPTLEQLVVFPPWTARTVDFTFRVAAAQITGRVLITGAPATVPSFPVTVTATSLASELQMGMLGRVSQPIDANGFFTLTVTAGQHVVSVLPANLTYLPPAPAPAQATDGQTTDLGTLYLTPLLNLARLNGHVQTPAGQGVAGIQVTALNLDPSLSLPSRSTTSEGTDGAFSLAVTAGTWRVAIALAEEDPYMPYRLQWQAIVTVAAGQTVNDIDLLIAPASSRIAGALVVEGSAAPAVDACGVVAAYKAGEPIAYDYRRFTGGQFDLPVISGTFRLAVLPIPAVEQLAGYTPPGCAAGKYLAKTLREVAVADGETVAITVPLRITDATIHGQLWDDSTDAALTGWGGQIMGWSQGNWSAAQIDPLTGIGDLPASAGVWWLAYRIDPQSSYQAQPGVARADVPTGTVAITLPLSVIPSAATISGVVLDPDGNPLPRIAVAAINLENPRGGSTQVLTREDGSFTIGLDYGTYQISIFGPAERQEAREWISPEPQRVKLSPAQPSETLEFRFRRGNATISGRISLAASVQAGQTKLPALVWAANRDGHTKGWASQDGAYSLPVLQGQTWTVGAIYEAGASLWVTATMVSVNKAEIPLDLILTRPYTLATGLVQAVDRDAAFYGELADVFSAYIPAGALPTDATANSQVAALRSRKWVLHLSETVRLLLGLRPKARVSARLGCLLYGDCLPPWRAAGLTTTAAAGVTLLTPAYTIAGEDAGGNPIVGSLSAPAVLRIPYDAGELASLGFTEADLQALYYNETLDAWERAASFIVDQDADAVVIFAERLGSYALVATEARNQVYLPLSIR